MATLPIDGVVTRFAGNLRYPKLVMLTAGLFFADLLIPDFIPFVDEILLALITMLLMALKDRKGDGSSTADGPPGSEPKVITVEPNRSADS